MPTDIETNKGKARRIWEEIFPQGDEDASPRSSTPIRSTTPTPPAPRDLKP